MEENDKIGLVVSVLKDMFVACFLYRGWDVPNAFEAFDSIPQTAILMPGHNLWHEPSVLFRMRSM